MLFGSATSDMLPWVALPLEVGSSKVSVATQVEGLCLFSSRIGIAQRYYCSCKSVRNWRNCEMVLWNACRESRRCFRWTDFTLVAATSSRMATWLHSWPRSLQHPLVNSGVFCIRMDTRLMCAHMPLVTVHCIPFYPMLRHGLSFHILIAQCLSILSMRNWQLTWKLNLAGVTTTTATSQFRLRLQEDMCPKIPLRVWETLCLWTI